MKLLAVGDIHLGRLPTRIPDDFALSTADLGPAAAWRSTVDLAIREQVLAVLLAGDVVESEKDFFEGFRELKTGVEQLTQAGISVVAVAGNHDVEVLPRLAKSLGKDSGFTLLGKGGVWQSLTLTDGQAQARIWGWSFPQREVRMSPLAGAKFERGTNVQLGLLHCDLDQSASPYAPVKRSELDRTGLDGWLLGHIHAPHTLTPEALIGYLGCLSGMDPGEPGPHGPWLLEIGEGRVQAIQQIPIAPLRWQALPVDLSALRDTGELNHALISAAEALDKAVFSDGRGPLAVGLRVKLVGRTALANDIATQVEQSVQDTMHFPVGDRHYFVEHMTAELLPEVDIEELATLQDPSGLLAARLLLLDAPAGNSERLALMDAARQRFKSTLNETRWREIESNAEQLTDTAIIEQLRVAGTAALQKLLAQQ